MTILREVYKELDGERRLRFPFAFNSFRPCSHQAGGFRRFHKNIAARPPFWRQSLGKVWGKSSSLAFSVRILGFPLRFFVQRSVLLVGQKSLAPKSFRATMGGAPLPRTHSTPSPRAKTQHNPARTAYADRALPWSLGSSPTSPALGAKVWRKVWGKSLDFESLEQSLSFFYEISGTPLPGVSHCGFPIFGRSTINSFLFLGDRLRLGTGTELNYQVWFFGYLAPIKPGL